MKYKYELRNNQVYCKMKLISQKSGGYNIFRTDKLNFKRNTYEKGR